jgi:hypothetical protein
VETWRFGTCLDPKAPLVVDLPALSPAAEEQTGPVSLVLVSTPGSSHDTHAWDVEIDGERVSTEVPGMPPRARDTLGPFVLRERPASVAIRGSARARGSATCKHGGLAEVRLLGPDRSALASVPATVTTFAPPRDLGVPVRPASWVSARGLSRYRAGIEPTPEVHAVSLVLGTDADLAFAPEWLPGGGETPIDLVVTLTGSRAGDDARLVVLVDGAPMLDLAPPATLDRSWQSAIVTIAPPGPTARLSLRLVGAPRSEVEVRDIGLFSRARPVAGTERRDR